MKITESKLSLLMNSFKVRSKDLAEYLHVDSSLISKWKNNKRNLSNKSNYPESIAEYFLNLDKIYDYTFIKNLIHQNYPKANVEDMKELKNYFQKWILESRTLSQKPSKNYSKNQNEYSTTFTVYRKNEGRRKAVLDFLDLAISMPENQEILLLSQENMTWLIEDKNFFNDWDKKLYKLIQKNHKIQIIHTIDRETTKIAETIEKWFNLHMLGGLKSYYYPKYQDTIINHTLFIIKNTCAITGASKSTEQKEIDCTYFFNDLHTVKNFQNTFFTIKEICNPLIINQDIKKSEELIKKLLNLLNEPDNEYHYSDIPQFTTMDKNDLIQILIENSVKKDKTLKILNIFDQYNEIHKNKNIKTKYLYNLKKMEDNLKYKNILYEDLSLLCEKEIYVKKDLFKKHIKNTLKKRNKNCEIGFIYEKPKKNFGANCIIKQNHKIIAYSNKNKPIITSNTEPTITQAFEFHFNEIWNSIPSMYKKDLNLCKIENILKK